MQFYIIILTSFLSLTASALPSSEPAANVLAARQNANRPVPTGACCVSNTSLKQDVCNVNGQTGRCVPAGVNNCTFLLASALPFISSRLSFLTGFVIGVSRCRFPSNIRTPIIITVCWDCYIPLRVGSNLRSLNFWYMKEWKLTKYSHRRWSSNLHRR